MFYKNLINLSRINVGLKIKLNIINIDILPLIHNTIVLSNELKEDLFSYQKLKRT